MNEISWKTDFKRRFFNPSIPSPAEIERFIEKIEKASFLAGQKYERERVRKQLPKTKDLWGEEAESVEESKYFEGFNDCLDEVKEILSATEPKS